jgi:hypothetical protein
MLKIRITGMTRLRAEALQRAGTVTIWGNLHGAIFKVDFSRRLYYATLQSPRRKK